MAFDMAAEKEPRMSIINIGFHIAQFPRPVLEMSSKNCQDYVYEKWVY